MFITNQSIVEASFYYGQLYRDTLTTILLVIWALWTHRNDIVLNWALPKATVVLHKVKTSQLADGMAPTCRLFGRFFR